MKSDVLLVLIALVLVNTGCRSFQVEASLQPSAALTATARTAGGASLGQNIDTVVQRWADAFAAIHAVRGSQSFALLGSDGSPQPVSGQVTLDPRGALKSTAEEYLRVGNDWHYRVVGHFIVGDETTTWDGTTASRYRPWLNEIYHLLPASYAKNSYWLDDLDDITLLTVLAPLRQDSKLARAYDLIGTTHDPDGRVVIVLQVRPGWHNPPFGVEGRRMYLDAATYLPHRVVSPAPAVSRDKAAFERTITLLQTTAAFDPSEFTVNPAPGTVNVYEQAHFAPRIESFQSLAEAAKQTCFPLFERPGQTPREVYTMYLVEKDGRRAPVIAAFYPDNVTLVEGLYLPKYGRTALDANQVGKPQMVELGGQSALLRMGRSSWGSVTLERQGTWIEMGGNLGNQTRVVQLAKDL